MIHFQHMRRRKYFAVADFGCVCLAVAVAFYVRTKIPLPVFTGLLTDAVPAGFQTFWIPTAVLGLIFLLIQYAFGVYDLWHSSSLTNWLQRVLPANLVLLATAFTYLYLSQNFSFPRSLLIAVFTVNYFLSALWRVLYFKLTEAELSEVLLVGRWSEISSLVKELDSPPFNSHIRVKAVFVPGELAGLPPEHVRKFLALPFEEFENYTAKNPYASVIVAPSDSFQKHAFQCVLTAAKRGVNIYAVPTIYEILLGRLQHLRINDLPLLELRLNSHAPMSRCLKRAFDITLSAILLFLLALPMVIISLLIRFTSSGSPIYSQIRIGQLGKEFRIFKFRTMVNNAEAATGAVFASHNDPRITKLGRFLRATRLDELPQLWNILMGEMSFVGPRPERPIFVKQFEERIPGYGERHRIKPGVTGLAQVSGNYVSSPEVKLKYDLAYISNSNLLFDAQILFRTLKTVFTRVGI